MDTQSVELIDSMGTDLTVVNAARVSFEAESHFFKDQDRRLIAYLAEHNHWSPFAHCFLSFKIVAPIAVARQLAKHQVGLAWNETSRRYVDSEPSFWQPEIWREKAINKKQGSLSTGVANQEEWSSRYERICALACGLYEDMISSRICPEQARLILPQSAMTSWIWSGSLYAFSRVYALRITPDAQKETRDAAREIGVYAKELFPYSWEALTGER